MDIKQIINEINEKMGYHYDQELHLSRSNYSDELRSISQISNIEHTSYDSSFAKEELANLSDAINFNEKKEFQLFGDDVHKILELAYDSSYTKDAICEKMTSVQGKIDFENLYTKLMGNLQALCSKYNLDEDAFYSELKVCDGYNQGKFDLVVRTKNGEHIIIDYKTSSNITINYKLQINMYRKILKSIYNINISSALLVKIDKQDYNFKVINVEEIANKYIDPILENGVLDPELTLEVINNYITNENAKLTAVVVDNERQKELLVEQIKKYNLQIAELQTKSKAAFEEYKNINKEVNDLKTLIEERLNEILSGVDLNEIGDEYLIANTDLKIIKKDKANGNSPKFVEEYNNKEAIIAFCSNNATDFFNKVSDLRSLKSYMWKNFEDLHTPKWKLDYEIVTDENDFIEDSNDEK